MKSFFTKAPWRPYLSRVLTSRRLVRVAGCVAILLVSLTLFRQSFQILLPRSVLAQGRLFRLTQPDETLAPAAPIQPVSVSVINFAELAAKDAKASKEMNPNAAPGLRAVRPPGTITEDSTVAPRPTSPSAQSNDIHPLVSSPAPSQSFLAQEDGPEVGTGTFDIPPDTMGAVGPDKLFVNVNNNYRVQDKTTGAALSTVSIETFWASSGAAGVFDPRVQYDPYNNRWIVAATSNSGTATSSVLVGVSATSDPLGTFTLFRFIVGCAAGAPNCDANGETPDFPMLGFNKNWVAVGWNQFLVNGGQFVSGKMLAIDYPTLRTGTAISTIFTTTLATNSAAFCMHPATTLSATEDTLYVPAHVSSAAATYRLHRMTGTPGAPSYVLDTVSKTRTGGGWTQPGGDILPQACVGTAGTTCPTTRRFIDSGDAFIRSNVVFRNGNIWYAQTVGLPSSSLFRTAAQWTEIDASGNFVDGGRVDDSTASQSSGEWYAYPSIAVNMNNDVLLGFSNFAASHFARAGYALRMGSDAAGTMRDPVIFKDGEDYYAKTFSGSRNRWGDYSHTVVDPTNDTDLWTIQEYAGLRTVQDNQTTTNNSRWGTWWAKVPPGGPLPTPTPTPTPTPSPTPTPTPGPCPTTLTVNTNGDASDAFVTDGTCATVGGVCTLRAAIQEANSRPACGPVDINVSGVSSPITLGTALPDVGHNINFNGPGPGQLTVTRSTANGIPNFRIFNFSSGASATISGLTISGGNNSDQGAGISNAGTLTLLNSVVSGNNSSFSNNGFGGGIFNSGTLMVVNSVVSGNTTSNGNSVGGGIYNSGTLTVMNTTIRDNVGLGAGGIANYGTLTVFNSTINGNAANGVIGWGGGIFNSAVATVTNSTISGNYGTAAGAGIYNYNNGTITLTNSTVTLNTATDGTVGGIAVAFNATATKLKNTIVANNSNTDLSGTVNSQDYNLIGNTSGASFTGTTTHNITNMNALLGPLANNGGPTSTHVLLPGSPAIDAGDNCVVGNSCSPALAAAITTDQRGTGFPRVFNASVDIGAFEVQGGPPPTPTPTPTPSPTPPPVVITVNRTTDVVNSGDGFCTLREAITAANTNSASGAISGECPAGGGADIITFGVSGTINLTSALPAISSDMAINGPGSDQLTIKRSTAGGTPFFRIFTVSSGVTATVSGLTISGGSLADFGTGIRNSGTLTLSNSVVSGNGGGNGGGGIYNTGNFVLNSSMVTGNSVETGGGGGILNSGGTIAIANSTVSGNTPANGSGGGIANDGLLATLTLTNSIVNGNTLSNGPGGGIANFRGTVALTNSTLSGNTSGGYNGGGLLNNGGTTTLTNCTVSGNISGTATIGGGIYSQTGTVNIRNTIVANNTVGSGGSGPDLFGPFNSQDYNLIGNSSGASFTGTTAHNITNANASLGPLANNGGPTKTHSLLAGSPAINAGDNCVVNNSCLPALAAALSTDQRGGGFSRLVNSAVDIGAFEVQPAAPPTIQFSAASYPVNEGSPRVDITLTRSGDTTSSASVNFATNDAAGLTNCNVINGVASPRCDYENTIGTATWAAGDATSKTFSIAIVDDSYAEGTETFTISLNSPSGAALGAQSTATVTITDNEATNGANPIDSTNFFVRQQYIDFLGREPDPPGFAGWTSTINNCSGDTTQCDRIHVSQLFFQSAEFQTRGYFVYRFYPVAFGRKPDYGEFVPDLASVSGFLDATQLEAAKVAFIAAFMARPSFVSTYNSLNNTQYVDTLLNTAGVTLLPSPATRQSMIDGLNNSTLTRGQVLRQIVESAEVSNKYNHQAYAVMEYFGYLRRQPDSFYLQWIAVLDTTNDARGMVTGFATSAEYRNRFGP